MAAGQFTESNLLAALQMFHSATDKQAIEQANAFLSDFQHSTEAWSLCNALLLAQSSPFPAQLFASQTLRAKVTYDLAQLDGQQVIALRDTLLAALENYREGPKTIQVQLCLALSGLALQAVTWDNPVGNLLRTYGRNPATVPILLEFLTVLPEEINGNTKIPITNELYRARAPVLLTDNSVEVLNLLTLYVQAPGVNMSIQKQVFKCLSSWVVAGEVAVQSLIGTPLLDFAFQALVSESLFETAVELICDVIHETQEIYDNEDVIQIIVPKLIDLRPKIHQARNDPEQIKGLTRILSEAGETYRQLIVQHPDTFQPLLLAILDCSSYHDLDIVPITFQFWYRLGQSLGKQSEIPQFFLETYTSVMDVIIKHLHFPADENHLVGQEADDFRSFRHVMGDTLKDCCYILGSEKCLMKTYSMIVSALNRGSSAGAQVSWQEIEAPLFAMRSMGGSVDPRDDKVVPNIMDLIPTLPTHPKIRYAAMLVVSRYTEWINMHPSYIPFQLTYLSSGFEEPDSEVSAAAAQAMKYLCKDCKIHLVTSIPQLHTFINTMGPRMSQDDRVQIYEAIGHILSSMPMEDAGLSLKTFAFELLGKVHAVSSKATPASKDELKQVADYLEQLEVLLSVIDTFGEELPKACELSCEEAWTLFDPLLQTYGGIFFLTERITRVLRHGVHLFGTVAVQIVPAVLSRLTASFTETGFSSCMWVASKIVQHLGDRAEAPTEAFASMWEGMSAKVALILQITSPSEVPDVIEDYLQLAQTMLDFSTDVFFSSIGIQSAFATALVALTLVHADIIFASLDLFRIVLSHECLDNTSKHSRYPLWSARIRDLFINQGYQLLAFVIKGLTGDFPDETVSAVIALMYAIACTWPQELSSWLPSLLEPLPVWSTPVEAKSAFLSGVNRAIADARPDKVKQCVTNLFRASRKARERRELKAA